MDIGTGIVVGTAIVTGGATLFRYCRAPAPRVIVDTKCPAHSGVELGLAKGAKRMDKMCSDIATIRRIVIAIAAELKVPLDKIKAEMQDMVE